RPPVEPTGESYLSTSFGLTATLSPIHTYCTGTEEPPLRQDTHGNTGRFVTRQRPVRCLFDDVDEMIERRQARVGVFLSLGTA
ncbi:MAG: hypothetical protein KAI73_12050, partial [Rhodospirillaceae bacterium]|nr:hypothetical protein [Rhodospirillaceae bacterium]